MAKHMIYPTANPDGTDADRRIELQWQRERGAQIAVTKFGGVGDRTREYTEKGDPTWVGEAVDLTRDQINHLIRQLRAARDQAFGRDE